MKEIIFTKEKFELFKSAYNKALHDNAPVFIFEGVEVLTLYGKYVIEYLSDKFQTNESVL